MTEKTPRRLAALETAIESKDSTSLEALVQEFSEFCFKEVLAEMEPFPQTDFKFIIDLMETKAFREMDGSHHLLMLFEYDWARLSDAQKEVLLVAVKDSFDQYDDWMSQFVISEILGEYYCDERAFRVLVELRKTPNEISRSLIPHGFEHIITEATGAGLRKQALGQLVSMKNDPSEKVRNETTEALSNVHRKGAQ